MMGVPRPCNDRCSGGCKSLNFCITAGSSGSHTPCDRSCLAAVDKAPSLMACFYGISRSLCEASCSSLSSCYASRFTRTAVLREQIFHWFEFKSLRPLNQVLNILSCFGLATPRWDCKDVGGPGQQPKKCLEVPCHIELLEGLHE